MVPNDTQFDNRKIFESISSIPANKICLECRNEKTTHASVNNGVFLCENCSKEHEKLGHRLSFICPFSQEWNAKQLAMLKAGGNEKCENFFEKRGFIIGGQTKRKEIYNAKQAHVYRDKLLMNAEIIEKSLYHNDMRSNNNEQNNQEQTVTYDALFEDTVTSVACGLHSFAVEAWNAWELASNVTCSLAESVVESVSDNVVDPSIERSNVVADNIAHQVNVFGEHAVNLLIDIDVCDDEKADENNMTNLTNNNIHQSKVDVIFNDMRDKNILDTSTATATTTSTTTITTTTTTKVINNKDLSLVKNIEACCNDNNGGGGGGYDCSVGGGGGGGGYDSSVGGGSGVSVGTDSNEINGKTKLIVMDGNYFCSKIPNENSNGNDNDINNNINSNTNSKSDLENNSGDNNKNDVVVVAVDNNNNTNTTIRENGSWVDFNDLLNENKNENENKKGKEKEKEKEINIKTSKSSVGIFEMIHPEDSEEEWTML